MLANVLVCAFLLWSDKCADSVRASYKYVDEFQDTCTFAWAQLESGKRQKTQSVGRMLNDQETFRRYERAPSSVRPKRIEMEVRKASTMKGS